MMAHVIYGHCTCACLTSTSRGFWLHDWEVAQVHSHAAWDLLKTMNNWAEDLEWAVLCRLSCWLVFPVLHGTFDPEQRCETAASVIAATAAFQQHSFAVPRDRHEIGCHSREEITVRGQTWKHRDQCFHVCPNKPGMAQAHSHTTDGKGCDRPVACRMTALPSLPRPS